MFEKFSKFEIREIFIFVLNFSIREAFIEIEISNLDYHYSLYV